MKIYGNYRALLEAQQVKIDFVNKFGQDLADEFNKKKNNLKGEYKDISFWLKRENTPEMLAKILSSPLTTREKVQAQIDKILASPRSRDVELVSKQDGYEIYKINTPSASVKYGLVVGGFAKWCISGAYAYDTGTDGEGRDILEEAEYYWRYYDNRYKDYYFIFGHGTKYALCIERYEPLEYAVFAQDDTQFSPRKSQPQIPYLSNVRFDGRLIYGKLPESVIFVIKDGILVEYNGSGGDVIIPDEVIEIDDRVFFDCKSLTSITAPNVRTIGKSAFEHCESLKTVDMPNVQKIDISAFENCHLLKTATIPNVREIGAWAFSSCNSLISLTAPKVQSIDRGAFEDCTSLTDYNINPNAEIGSYAFYDTPIEEYVRQFRLAEYYSYRRYKRRKGI